MLKNLMMVVNPFSGRGISQNLIGKIITHLCKNGYAVTVYVAGEYSTGQLAAEYGKFHELVVCVGGDGTLSSVISGLLGAGDPPVVGYIPYGTANDVAATLALSRDPIVAAQTIIDGTPAPLDIGLFGGRYFTYIAAFGAFTGVSYSTPQSAKRALGQLAYVLGGLASVPAITARHTVVEYDGGVIEGDFIFGGVTNSTSVAGFVKLDPKHVDLADGQFEVILVRQPITLADFNDILTTLISRGFSGESDNVILLHSGSVKFTFNEEVPWTVDGEDGGGHSVIEITNCREAIKIIV